MFAGCAMEMLGAKASEPGKLVKCMRAAEAALQVVKDSSGKAFFESCMASIPKILQKVVALAQREWDKMNGALVSYYQNIAGREDFGKALEADKVDAKLSSQLCNCAQLQNCYRFLSYGLDKMMCMQKLLASTAAAAGHPEFKDQEAFQQVSSDANALSDKMKMFMNMEADTKGQSLTLFSIASCVGDATVSQALYRDLKTGETRQALVNKAVSGVRKRGWKVHATLTQRCNAVLTGKAR